jgi:hypothetical protein
MGGLGEGASLKLPSPGGEAVRIAVPFLGAAVWRSIGYGVERAEDGRVSSTGRLVRSHKDPVPQAMARPARPQLAAVDVQPPHGDRAVAAPSGTWRSMFRKGKRKHACLVNTCVNKVFTAGVRSERKVELRLGFESKP